jgi:hypothetical protein
VWDLVIPDRVSPSPACLLLVSGPIHEEPQQQDAHEMGSSFCKTEHDHEVGHSYSEGPCRDHCTLVTKPHTTDGMRMVVDMRTVPVHENSEKTRDLKQRSLIS